MDQIELETEATEEIKPATRPVYDPRFSIESMSKEFKFRIKMDRKMAIHKLARYFIEKYNVKTIKGNKRELLIYLGGIYVPGDEIIRKEIRELLEELCATHNIKEIIETIKDLCPVDRDAFVIERSLINFNNGIFDLNNKKIIPHDPAYLFLTKIPVDFDPKADCPVIKKFLSDVLDDDQIEIVQEWAGYALYREYFIKKAIIFVGEGDTGKTTLINLLFKFFGENNVCSMSLQKITSDKFSCAHLYTKNINLHDDLSFRDIKDNGAFKIATGNGIITGEKKFGDQFQFKNYAKLTFACNKIPDVKDADDDAYFNRWIVVRFNYQIDEKDRDKQLIHKMTTPQELSGFLNFAIEGLERLLKNERFSYNKNAEEIKTEMLSSGNPIALFAFECLEFDNNAWISKESMHKAYQYFTCSKNLPSTGIETFGRRLSKYAIYTSSGRPKDQKAGNQVTAWMNVKFKNTFNPSLPEENKKPEQQKIIYNKS